MGFNLELYYTASSTITPVGVEVFNPYPANVENMVNSY